MHKYSLSARNKRNVNWLHNNQQESCPTHLDTSVISCSDIHTKEELQTDHTLALNIQGVVQV
jgi:hypothetical protein